MQFIRKSLKTSLSFQRAMSAYYAVARGHQVGVYETWLKCEEQVKGFKGAKYKKFTSRKEAEHFISSASLDNGKNAGRNFTSQDIAVALGKRSAAPLASWKEKKQKNETKTSSKIEMQIEEFWPESDGDSFEQDQLTFTDAELHAAMDAVDSDSKNTLAVANTLKRKTTSKSTSSDSKYLKHASKIWEPVGVKEIGLYEFQIDVEGFVIVYTDGSCLNNGQAKACAGYGVYFGENHPLNAAKPVLGRVTNNVGEIQAAIHAIKVAKQQCIQKICVSTDSQFLINAITAWIGAWKCKGWRLKNGDPVKNVADFKELDELLADNTITVKWNYVKAHKGIKGNEMADKLAREGSEMYRRIHFK